MVSQPRQETMTQGSGKQKNETNLKKNPQNIWFHLFPYLLLTNDSQYSLQIM